MTAPLKVGIGFGLGHFLVFILFVLSALNAIDVSTITWGIMLWMLIDFPVGLLEISIHQVFQIDPHFANLLSYILYGIFGSIWWFFLGFWYARRKQRRAAASKN
jgi:hypothetical protein